MSGHRDETTAPKPEGDDKEPHKVDEKTQEDTAEERAENSGYD